MTFVVVINYALTDHVVSIDLIIKLISKLKIPERMVEWLERRTRNHMIAGSSLTGASNILGQVMNSVDTP